MKDNGTGIHWHGMRQLGTVGEDGVPGITECETFYHLMRIARY